MVIAAGNSGIEDKGAHYRKHQLAILEWGLRLV